MPFPIACIPRSVSVVDQFAISPIRTISGIRFAGVPAWNYNQSQEPYGSKGITAAAADGDVVGQACSYAPDCSVFGRTTTSARPAIGSSYGQVAWVFNNSESLQFRDSTTQFDWIHKTGVFTIAFAIRATSLAAAQAVINNNNLTAAKIGFYVYLNTTGTINAYVSNGTVANWNVTTTDTLSTSGNCVWVFVRCDGTTMRIRVGSAGTDATGSKSGSLSTSSASDTLTIGQSSTGGTSRLRANLGPVLMFDKSLSVAEMQQCEAWVPTRSSENPFPSITSGNLSTTYPWGLWHWYSASSVFTDTALTTNVSANGDAVNGCKNLVDITRSWSQNRNWTCPGGANTNAIWASSVSNVTVPAPRWNNGRTTDLLKLPTVFPKLRKATYGSIGINLDTTNGSHFWHYSGSATSNYMAMTAAAYSGGGPQGPRFAWHTENSTAIATSNVNMLGDAHANFGAITNDGTSITAYCNGYLGDTTGSGSPTNSLTDNGITTPDSCGGNGVGSTNWNMDGYKLVDFAVPWKMSAADLLAIHNYYLSALGVT